MLPFFSQCAKSGLRFSAGMLVGSAAWYHAIGWALAYAEGGAWMWAGCLAAGVLGGLGALRGA